MKQYEKEWVRQVRSWMKEQQARVAECKASIKCAKVIIQNNKIQIGCIERVYKPQVSALNKFLSKNK